jgi:hypothetical protein
VGPFGYPDKKSFEAAIQRELDAMAESGREPTNPPPKQKAAPGFKLRGEPDSLERWSQAAELVGDPSIAQMAAYDRVAGELQNAALAVQRAEERGEYDQATIDRFASASRHLAALNDPAMYAAFEDAIYGSEAAEHLEDAVRFAAYQQANAETDAAVAMEQGRLNQRQQLLESEYQAIEKRTGPDGLVAADYLARSLGDLAYAPQADEDQLRASLRATAEQVAATQRGMRQGAFLKAFDDEAARRYGPAGNDAEREKWETELRNGSVEIVERAFGDPEDAADRAVNSMIRDDRRAANKGKSDFEIALDAELDEINSHARQNSPHMRRLADIAVEEFEATHDESGRRTTRTDALGRESERRELRER